MVGIPAAKLRADVVSDLPPCDRPDRLGPLLFVASLLVRHVPSASAAKISGAVRRWRQFLAFVGASEADWRVVLAFIVVRCCPPVGTELPPFVLGPVLPSTAAGDVDACNRAARLGVEGMSAFDGAFSDFRVSALLRNIKARTPRLQSHKKPILYSGVERYWELCARSGSPTALRDGFAAVLALCFGTRPSELLSLLSEDLDVIYIYDKATGRRDRMALQVTFRNVKTRQSIFSTLDPFRVTSAHPLLMRAFRAFDDKVEFLPEHTIFRSDNGLSRPLARDWLDRIAKSIDPETSPHCFRVGLATELWSAGAELQDIMAIGRWASLGAILYIIGSLERQATASDRLGKGRLSFEAGALHRRLGTSLASDDVPVGPSAQWSEFIGSTIAAGEDPDWSDSDAGKEDG